MDKKIKYSHPVPPFVRYCSAIIPTMFDDSLSYYEALCALNNFIQKNIVEVINNNAAISESLQKQFAELKSYVEHYFDNLDVQDEINNKLDEMALNGQLVELIEAGTDTTQFIFPKFWANAYSGDCNLIKSTNYNVLIDCYNYTHDQYLYVKQMLDSNEVSHLDVFICSHYHGDHIGNFENLISDGYIDSDTKLFMPAETTQFGWSSDIARIKAICEANDLQYYVPYEGEVYELGNLKFTFYNCDAKTMDSYYPSGSGSQNSTSMITLVEHLKVKALYTGDATWRTYDYLLSHGFNTNVVDLHKVGHHGINDTTSNKFFDDYRAKYAVISGGILDFAKNNMAYGAEATILNSNFTDIFSTFEQNDYIRFVSNGSELKVKNGKPSIVSRGYIGKTVYVDINATGAAIQDGTEEHPYHEIQQAISCNPNSTNGTLNIVAKSGDYCLSHEESDSNKNSIVVRKGRINITKYNEASTCSIRGLNVNNGYLSIDGFTIYMDERNVRAIQSDLIIKNCTITCDDIASYDGYAIQCDNSRVYIEASTIEKATGGINVYNGGILVTQRVTFGSFTGKYINDEQYGGLIYTHNTQYLDSSDKYSNLAHFANKYSLMSLYNNNSGDFTLDQIVLNAPMTSFDYLIIEYITDQTARGSIIDKVDGNHSTFINAVNYNGSTTLNEVMCRLTFTPSQNKIEIGRHLKRATTVSDGTYTIATSGHYMAIRNIWGVKEEQIINLR